MVNKKSKIPGLEEQLKCLQIVPEEIMKRLSEAMQIQKKYYDTKHEPIAFKKGEMVLLATKNLKLKCPKRVSGPNTLGHSVLLNLAEN